MSDEPTSFFGIDLGTTYSVISYIDEYGKPAVIRNSATGKETLPSVVYFESAGNVVVGEQAKNLSVVYPDKVVSRVKRSMGQPRNWEFDDVVYSPESISALILKRLATDAAEETGRAVNDVVITVPAYFGMLEREATKQAGTIAGLNVIGIVPEPVAAALQYEVAATDSERIILVYDLGGGTFDTTVIRVSADRIDVLCTDGDQELGGVDWDDRLVGHLVDEFTARTGVTEDPTDDREFMQELQEKAEDVKRQLSMVTSRNVPLRFGGQQATVEITRDMFEQMTSDLLERTLGYTDRTLEKLSRKIATDDPAGLIDEVLLVGGSSRMPAVKAALEKKFPGWKPRLHDPDLAVAKGAARYALSSAIWDWSSAGDDSPTAQERKERVAAIAQAANLDPDKLAGFARKEITTVLPKAFGVRLVDTDAPGWQNDIDRHSYVEHLVHADQSLPTSQDFTAGTVVPDQREVKVEIYEQAGGEESREMAANKAVDRGSGLITGLPAGLPADSPIEVLMTVSREGLLRVEANEPRSGRDLIIEVQVSVLSDEEVKSAAVAVSAITVRS
ncbi:Hsp70 family protein [Actinoplanes bogorensis]|uniref:Hsp70 family protein n=1 Tax=Paractinoplanes bogorensis TaxID=1610840 RepID=A0ABS5Z1G2_9ACTN|nr:Hsp70 family protein [Actinoplanes bogorensis]MBU2668235.1 Hsp70 family protein [Actinoplanes bogorensis]